MIPSRKSENSSVDNIWKLDLFIIAIVFVQFNKFRLYKNNAHFFVVLLNFGTFWVIGFLSKFILNYLTFFQKSFTTCNWVHSEQEFVANMEKVCLKGWSFVLDQFKFFLAKISASFSASGRVGIPNTLWIWPKAINRSACWAEILIWKFRKLQAGSNLAAANLAAKRDKKPI